ncbi:MAG TPA: biotin/lipoyl-containing protein [Holophaga sp.]|nr:biotin/lipoyl-containing protein [Holophaga sp.]
MATKFKLKLEGQAYDVERRDGIIVVNGVEFTLAEKEGQFIVAGNPHLVKLGQGTAEVDGIGYAIAAEGLDEPASPRGRRAASAKAALEAGALTAIMPGLIIKVLKKEGDKVEAGETVLILEAMKMQNEVQAKAAGTIRQMKVKQGDSVEMRQVLCVIE